MLNVDQPVGPIRGGGSAIAGSSTPVSNRADSVSSPVDADFYDKLKALHAKTGQTVYQCCKRLGLQTGPWYVMDEAERMVITLTKQGKIVWNGCQPIFQ